MKLATCEHPQALALAVRQHHKDHPFMAAVEFLGRYHLFSHPDSTHDAAMEAIHDFPGGNPAGEFEYLTPATLHALRNPQASPDDLLTTLRNLGRLRTPR